MYSPSFESGPIHTGVLMYIEMQIFMYFGSFWCCIQPSIQMNYRVASNINVCISMFGKVFSLPQDLIP